MAPRGSNGLGGPLGPYRYAVHTLGTVPSTRYRTGGSGHGAAPYGNSALGSTGPIVSGQGGPSGPPSTSSYCIFGCSRPVPRGPHRP